MSTLIQDLRARYHELGSEDPYPEEGHSLLEKAHGGYLLLVRTWLKNLNIRPEGFTDKQYLSFTRFAEGFFVDKEDRLYRRSIDSHHKLVVNKTHRMYMM